LIWQQSSFKRLGLESGVALITAMLITALVSLVALDLVSRQQLDIRRTSNLLDQDQAWLYCLGMEAWSSRILARDATRGPIDHLHEEWAMQLPPLPVEGGGLIGELIDQQGLFNLNNLLHGGAIDPAEMARFQRLLIGLEIPADVAEGLAHALADWLDADQDRRFPGGAEDQDYLMLRPAYRAANAPFRSVSELRLVKGFVPKIYRAVSPFVTVLPERTPININTAPLPVIVSLVPDLRPMEAAAILEGRGAQGYQNVGVLQQHPALAGKGAFLSQGAGISVASRWFMGHGRATVGRVSVEFYSLLFRNQGTVIPVQRTIGTW